MFNRTVNDERVWPSDESMRQPTPMREQRLTLGGLRQLVRDFTRAVKPLIDFCRQYPPVGYGMLGFALLSPFGFAFVGGVVGTIAGLPTARRQILGFIPGFLEAVRNDLGSMQANATNAEPHRTTHKPN